MKKKTQFEKAFERTFDVARIDKNAFEYATTVCTKFWANWNRENKSLLLLFFCHVSIHVIDEFE